MAKNIAAALNAWTREGLDMLGGADGEALGKLLDDYMGDPGSSSEDSDSNTRASMNNSFIFILFMIRR